jgi:ribosomal protein S27AE
LTYSFKVRREYFKFIQQQTWLPRCLRCAKSTIMAQHTGQHTLTNNATTNVPTVNGNNVVDQSEHMIGDNRFCVDGYNDDEVHSRISEVPPTDIGKHFQGTPIRTMRGSQIRNIAMDSQLFTHRKDDGSGLNNLKDTMRGGHISPSLSVGSVRRIYNIPKCTQLSTRDDKVSSIICQVFFLTLQRFYIFLKLGEAIPARLRNPTKFE